MTHRSQSQQQKGRFTNLEGNRVNGATASPAGIYISLLVPQLLGKSPEPFLLL